MRQSYSDHDGIADFAVTVPVSLFDVPTSTVGNTLFLPLDLLMEGTNMGGLIVHFDSSLYCYNIQF